MFDMFPMDRTSYEQERIRKIRPNVTAGRERYARLAASAGVEALDPFLDRRVVDFCSCLPGRMLLRNGWPKWILREAMAGLLPNEVRWGQGKPHIGWMYNQAFLRRRLDVGELGIEQLEETLGSFADAVKLRQAWRDFVATGVSEIIHSAYILSLWLQQNATRPVVNDQGFSYSSGTVGHGPNHRP
jgi:asparagine synthetase B (glutamine-hydrolysing)